MDAPTPYTYIGTRGIYASVPPTDAAFEGPRMDVCGLVHTNGLINTFFHAGFYCFRLSGCVVLLINAR